MILPYPAAKNAEFDTLYWIMTKLQFLSVIVTNGIGTTGNCHTPNLWIFLLALANVKFYRNSDVLPAGRTIYKGFNKTNKTVNYQTKSKCYFFAVKENINVIQSIDKF